MFPQDRVPGPGESGVSPGSLPGQEEMAAPSGGVPQGMAPGGTGDGGNDDWEARLEQMRAELQRLQEERERDISRLRSSYDQKIAQLEAERRREREEWERTFHELQMRGMDEEERLAYERQVLEEKLRRYEEERNQLMQELQAARTMGEAAQAFIQLGIDPSKLDLSSYDALRMSGWNAVVERIQDLERQLEEARKGSAQTQQQVVQQPPPEKAVPPETITNLKGQSPRPMTVAQALADLKAQTGREWTMPQVLDAVEAGQLDPQIVDNILRALAGES